LESIVLFVLLRFLAKLVALVSWLSASTSASGAIIALSFLSLLLLASLISWLLVDVSEVVVLDDTLAVVDLASGLGKVELALEGWLNSFLFLLFVVLGLSR
jgi:hypothetical protein